MEQTLDQQQLHWEAERSRYNSEIAGLTERNNNQMQLIEKLDADLSRLRFENTTAVNELADVKLRLDTAQETIKVLYSDAQIISDELLSEAESRDWCSEYDRFVDRVNGRLSRIELQQRIRNYEVSMTATVTFRVQVEATDEDGALQYANDMSIDLPSSYGSMYDIDISDLTADEANLA